MKLLAAQTLSILALFVALAAALDGDELHSTVKEMKDAEHVKYNKSHKKFRFFDADGSEFIDRPEFEKGLQKLGYKTSSKKLEHIMGELDMDKDGKVEFVEFMRPTAKKYKEERELEHGADTDRAMEHFDKDTDGQVTVDEFYNGLSHLDRMKSMSKEKVVDFVNMYADVDGDGLLSYDELDTIDPQLM
eukprot:CAMPEP_0184290654 /NCGR_PEP_ID=MMETSP1049-20130417/2833_1 /TAXON_ID=77928 /ORGANISM="Proteomonas sulcata, Strain CCMP704" /LENGTH=188 /DNA_ID=CAMNT_0026597855 /DNA_START=159 /DNA_END=725 /DNA_ORIENTATION=-